MNEYIENVIRFVVVVVVHINKMRVPYNFLKICFIHY